MKQNFYSKFLYTFRFGGIPALMLLAAMFIGVENVNSQSIYTIGSGSSTSSTYNSQETPFGTYYHDDRTIMKYDASELTAQGASAGNLVSVAFRVASPSAQAMNGFNVKIAFTSASGNITGFPSSSTTVYSATAYTTSSGWNTFNFSSPVYWNGTDNILVEVCFDNGAYTTSSSVYRDYNYGKAYGQYSDSYAGPGCSMSSGSLYSYRPQARFGILPPAGNDAGISSITSPTNPACAGTYPLTAVVSNYGLNQISPVSIGWSLNGVVQTGSSYTGTLDTIGGSGSSTASISLGSIAISTTPSVVKVWSSNPNNVTDTVNVNDTLEMTFTASLSGTYTIGSGGDYPNFTAAVNALETNGVCGPTTFLVQDSVFTEQITLDNIPGSSGANHVTFKSDPAEGGLATLQFSSSSFGDPHTWLFSGVNNVTLDSLEILANGSSYARVIEFEEENDSINIRNCHLETSVVNTSSSYYTVIYNPSGSGNLLNNATIENNHMIGGGYAMYMYGGSTVSLEQNNKILNNIIEDFYYYGVYMYYQNNIEVIGNHIENTGNSTFSYVTYRRYCDGASHFMGNTLVNNSGGYSMYAYYNDAIASSPAIIANNFILNMNSSYTSTNYGWYNYYSKNQKFYHNNWYHNGASSSYQAVRLYFSSSFYGGNEFKNNIVVSNNNASCIYFYNANDTTALSSDNNAYYYPNSQIGYFNSNYTNLAALQTGNGSDANSLELDPIYTDPSSADLHIGNSGLDGAAQNVGVAMDIDGELRPTATDIGADERLFPANDVAPSQLLSPSNPFCGDSAQIEVVVMNTGIDTLTTANVHYSLNGTAGTTFSWTGSLASNQSDTVSIASSAFNEGDELIVWTSMPNNVNDSNALLDTITLNIFEGLDGVYSIPGDFVNLTNAVDTLLLAGTCDTVWFDIATGSYDEPVTITDFTRNMPNTPVIFRSATGNTADVMWDNSTSDVTIHLDGADHVWFENITIIDTNLSAVNVVKLSGGADYNKFENCHMINAESFSTSNAYATVRNEPGLDNGNMFYNNMIEGGSYGYYGYGSSTTSLEEGNELVGNDITDFYYMGTYNYYQNDLTFNKNSIHKDGGYIYSYGAYFYYAMGDLQMNGNHIYSDASTWGFVYPIYMSQAIGSNPLQRGEIANNVVVGGWEGSTYTLYGARFYNASFKNFHHNTFINIDGSSSSYAMLASGNNVCEYANNIYASIPTDTAASYAYGNGYTAYITGGAVLLSDNNNYYSGSANPIYFNGPLDLATHQANNNLDLNSYDVNPNFIDTVNAILCNDVLDNAGMALGYTADIYDNARNMSTPDIGAVEFTGVGNFSLGPDTTICDASTVLYIGGATSSLTWLDGNSNVIGTGSSLNVDGATVMPVSVNFSNSCGSASDDISLDFVPNVELDENLHLCAGESEVLMPDGSGSINAAYTWFPTNETTSQITVDEPGVYSVHKSEDGCESEATILVTQSQAVDLVDAEACQSALPFTADATINAGDSYAWSDGGTTAANDLSTTGMYYVTVSDTLGCTTVDSMFFEAIDIPSAVIASDSHTSTLYYFNSMQSTGVGSNGTYAWDFGDGNTSSMANPSNIFPWSGPAVTYTVTLVITNACGTSEPTTFDVTVDPLGIDGVNGIENLSIYPNPSNGMITLSGNFNGEANVEVIDITGRVVYSSAELTASNKMNLDLSELATGAYQITITSGETVSTGQVIIK